MYQIDQTETSITDIEPAHYTATLKHNRERNHINV